MTKQESGSATVVVVGRETDGVGARKMGASFEDFNLARLIGRFPLDASVPGAMIDTKQKTSQ